MKIIARHTVYLLAHMLDLTNCQNDLNQINRDAMSPVPCFFNFILKYRFS